MKFATITINVTKNPVFLVGINPGRQRKSQQTHRVWEGNRSGDLIQEAIKGFDNLFLTNVTNYQDAELNDYRYGTGVTDLMKSIIKLQPRRIICLGVVPYLEVKKLQPNCEIIKLYHPSYIARFQRDRETYITELRSHLC